MGSIIFLRHGQAKNNTERILAGRTPGVPLTEEGVEQSEKASKFLEEIFTKDFLEVYSELKYKEYTAFAQTPTPWEVSMYADA